MMLPVQRYTFVSKLAPDVLIERLREQMGRRPSFFRSATKSYWGKVHVHSFKIEPSAISRRNGTVVIKGNVLTNNTGSIIQLLMLWPVITYIATAAIIAACIFMLFLMGLGNR